ncbi:MAG: LysM peptidoglycan-binding domain-containing protein [Oscillospiraceae bacterium]|jgi:hypothetical protein|nr:LysM peptidoglycan-binding domain-containing protein [Oscillospiraceae bacterium]
MMEFPLVADRMSRAQKVYGFDLTRDETVDIIVPESRPDISEILCVHADAFVRGKDAETGRGSVSGVINAVVLYAEEGGGRAQRLEAELPFAVSAADGALAPDMKVIARVSVVSCSARELEPRKIAIEAGVRVLADFYTDGEICLFRGGDAAGEGKVELLYETAEVCGLTDIREKTFVVSDEINLPQGCQPIGELLFADVRLGEAETKAVGSKLVFKGTAEVAPFYITDGGDMRRVSLNTEFSQIVEFDDLPPECEFDVTFMLTGSYVEAQRERGGNTVNIELHAAAQCALRERRTVKYIADAFVPGRAVECGYMELNSDGREPACSLEAPARGAIHARDVSGIIAAFALAETPELISDGGARRVLCGVNVTCLYADGDGNACTSRARVVAECAPFDADDARGAAAVSALAGNVSASMAPSGAIEIAVPVRFDLTYGPAVCERAISAITYEDSEAQDIDNIPSLTVTRAKPGERLWSIAKRYGSGVRLIMDANSIERESDLAAGSLLLIPRN